MGRHMPRPTENWFHRVKYIIFKIILSDFHKYLLLNNSKSDKEGYRPNYQKGLCLPRKHAPAEKGGLERNDTMATVISSGV